MVHVYPKRGCVFFTSILNKSHLSHETAFSLELSSVGVIEAEMCLTGGTQKRTEARLGEYGPLYMTERPQDSFFELSLASASILSLIKS